MSRKALAVTSLVALGFWIGLPTAARAQGVGAIGGTVTDISGAVLPGVAVTLSNPGIIGGSQEALTTDRGTFLFSSLVPGRYAVRANLIGFRPAIQENVVVNADVTARVDLRLEVGAVEEAITVTGTPALLDTASALKQTVLSAETLQTLPNRIDVWGDREHDPEYLVEQGGRGRVGIVPAVDARPARRFQPECLHDRWNGCRVRGQPQRALLRSVRLRGDQLPAWRRIGGSHAGRHRLQHGHQERHQRLSRRRHVRRREPRHGIPERVPRAARPAACGGSATGAAGESEHRARLRHPVHLRHRWLARGTHPARPAVVLRRLAHAGVEPVHPRQLQRRRNAGGRRQPDVERRREGVVADVPRQPALLLQ